MSFNAKNLTYGCSPLHVVGVVKLTPVPESNEPAFLRKLKSQYRDTDPVRHQRQLARPKRRGTPDEENDEDPIYVQETDPHEPIAKADCNALLEAITTDRLPGDKAQTGSRADSIDEIAPSPNSCPEGPVSQSVVIGAASKKRSIKIVGKDDPPDRRPKSEDEPAATGKQSQKNAKRPKLSFQEE
ncbi:MAG: hypothetical protein LQ346_002907 [Caloplaca aetnensis]|nr:MAG: hypothetical protein LQ346_002907 [Caloplaca aetnensis]